MATADIDRPTMLSLLTAQQLNLTVCPENVYSEDQTAFREYANLPISLFGILANAFNVVVFADTEMRTQLVNHFLLALSVSDLILLICNFFFLVLPVIVVTTESFEWNNVFPVIVRYSYPLALTAQTCGVYLTVLVSVHRFLGVCYPFKAKRWVTRAPVQFAIGASVAFSVLVNVPTWLELSVLPCYSERFKRPSQQIALAPFHEMTYIVIKKTVVYTIVMFVVPFAILIGVNWQIIMALRQSANLRTMHTYSTKSEPSISQHEMALKHFRLLRNSRYSEMFQTFSKLSSGNIFRPELLRNKCTNSWRDRTVTWMLVAIVALFLGCNGLAFCNSILESAMLVLFHSEDVDPQLVAMFERSVEVSNVLITLNSSTSTLVYVIFSSKYRMIFKSMLGIQKRVRVNRVAITTAVACHRAVELSLIPDEAESRKRREEIMAEVSKKRRATDATSFCSVGTSGTPRRNKLFRSQNSLTNSESNLRLMENQDSTIAEEKSVSTFTTGIGNGTISPE